MGTIQARVRLLAVTGIFVGLLAGCSNAGSPLRTSNAQMDQKQSMTNKSGLQLSSEQQQKLRSIFENNAPQDQQEVKQRTEQLANILSQDQVDMQALQQVLEERHERVQKNIPKIVDSLVAMRNVLTPQQRQQFVNQAQGPKSMSKTEIAQRLNLSHEQAEALDALRPTKSDGQLRTAITNFMQTGDRQSLQDDLKTAVKLLPSPKEAAKALASLNPQQRQQLIQIAKGSEFEQVQQQQQNDQQSQEQGQQQAPQNQQQAQQPSSR